MGNLEGSNEPIPTTERAHMRNDTSASTPDAMTQPLSLPRSERGLRGSVNRILDGFAPRVENRAMLVKMGRGRPSLVGDHRRGNHITQAFHLG